MGNNVTFDEMNELLDEIYRSGGETWVEIDGHTYYTDWGYGVVGIEFFIRMLKNRKSDNDATLVRHSVAEDADEIIEHVLNANMLNMPYHVYSDLFDAVDGLAVDIEKLQDENANLRKLLLDVWNDAMQFDGFWDYVHDDGEIYNEDELPHYYDRMRELGVEVDDD